MRKSLRKSVPMTVVIAHGVERGKAISTRTDGWKIRGKEEIEILRVAIEVVIIREWKMEEIDEEMIGIETDVLMIETDEVMTVTEGVYHLVGAMIEIDVVMIEIVEAMIGTVVREEMETGQIHETETRT